MADYVAALRKLAEHCDFKETISDMLRDRLVCGVRHDRIQRALLTEASLTFDTAFQKARSMETAEKNAQEMQVSTSHNTLSKAEETANVVDKQPKSKSRCYRCNGNHPFTTCRFKDFTCRKCKKTGHIARACRTQRSGGDRKGGAAHCVELSNSEDEEGENEVVQTIHRLGKPPNKGPLLERVIINKKEILMEVDTGASVSIISEATFEKLWKRREAPGLRHPVLR